MRTSEQRSLRPTYGFGAIHDWASVELALQRRFHLCDQLAARSAVGQCYASGVLALGPEDVARSWQRLRSGRAVALMLGGLDGIADDLGGRRLGIRDAIHKRGVGAVLQQTAHEIGQQVFVLSDRCIDAAGNAQLARSGDFLVKRLAHAVQALELEPRLACRNDGRGNGVSVVGRELRIECFRIRKQQAHARKIRHIGVQLARENGIIG
jgi:hypothetical protein